MKKILLLALMLAGSAHAQFDPQTMQKMVTFGGSMHVLAAQCQIHTPQELQAMKQQQKSATNLPDAQFEQLFQQGVQEANAKIGSMTPAEKQRACEQAKQMAQMGARR